MENNKIFSDIAFQNRKAIESCPYVSCYQCLETFDSKKVVDYTDDGQTGICPNCGIDSLIPHNYIMDIDTLRKVHGIMFEETIKKFNK